MREGHRSEYRQKGARILIIDDEEVTLTSLRRILSRRGYHVESVMSAGEGLEKLSLNQFELVITDLIMPEFDGLDFLREMRRRHLSVPTLMVTGYPTAETAREAIKLGACDYLTKPFTRAELMAPVDRAIQSVRKTSQAENQLAGINKQSSAPNSEKTSSNNPEESDESLPCALVPRVRFFFNKYSWAYLRQDGTVEIGINASTLLSFGMISSLVLPEDNQLLEYGKPCFIINVLSEEKYEIPSPVTGKIVEINSAFSCTAVHAAYDTWLVRVIPI